MSTGDASPAPSIAGNDSCREGWRVAAAAVRGGGGNDPPASAASTFCHKLARISCAEAVAAVITVLSALPETRILVFLFLPIDRTQFGCDIIHRPSVLIPSGVDDQ